MIIRLNENKFNKVFLIEGNKSRAIRQTRDVISQYFDRPPDDPFVVRTEEEFRNRYFGEGRGEDWFISLEPTAYKWLLESGPYEDYLLTIVSVINAEAKNSDNRTAFMQNVKTMSFRQVGEFVSEYERGYRTTARQNAVNNTNEETKINPRYGGEPLGPLSFEESKEYGEYSGEDAGKGGGQICYTTQTFQRQHYSNNEQNKLYLLLRDDWKTVNTTHDGSQANNGLPAPYNQKNGYDDYGLSMVFVWVTPDGELAYCNTRWNHRAEYVTRDVDQAFDVATLEKLMGAKFEDVFKVENFYDKYADPAHEAMINGKPIEEVFDGVEKINDSYALVSLGKKSNLFSYKENKLFFPRWIYLSNVRVINDYGDIKFYGSNGSYFLADDKIVNSYGLLKVFENRLSQGNIELDDIIGGYNYTELNYAGDIFIPELFGSYGYLYYANGRFYDTDPSYFKSIDERLNNGYDVGKLFGWVNKMSNGKTSYWVVSSEIEVHDNNGTGYNIVFNNKVVSDYWLNSYAIINRNKDLVILEDEDSEIIYFSDGETFDKSSYVAKLLEKIFSGEYNLEDLGARVEKSKKFENIAIIGIKGKEYCDDVEDFDNVTYNILNLETKRLEFNRWTNYMYFLDINGKSQVNERCLWIQCVNGEGPDEDDYDTILYIDGKKTNICVHNVEYNMVDNYFVAVDEDETKALYGFNKNGNFGNILEYHGYGWADDIYYPNNTKEYVVLDYGDGDATYYIPLTNAIVNDYGLTEYINEEFADGFGPGDFDKYWEELGHIAKIRIGNNNGYNLIDLRNKPYKLMFNETQYGEFKNIPDTSLYLATMWDGDYGSFLPNVMDGNGNFLIKEDDEHPYEIKPSSGCSKMFFTVRYNYGWNILDEHGHAIFNKNKPYITRFINGYCIVNSGNYNGSKYDIYNENLVKLNKEPFERINIMRFEETGELKP